MRIDVAWADALKQNVTLRLCVGALAAAVIGLVFVSMTLAGRPPLIVDRACESRIAATVGEGHTRDEIEGFSKQAMVARFDTNANGGNALLAKEERVTREKEQAEFRAKGIVQRLLVHKVKMDGIRTIVEADRILAVGDVRTAFGVTIEASFGSVERSAPNPYGLVLVKAVPLVPKKEGAP